MLFAAHISDGILSTPASLAGFGLAALFAAAGSCRLREEEIPRVALMTAAFFLAALIHIPLGPASVHLLLSGLMGVVLGIRVGLAIPIGLLLQYFLFWHGGFTSLGVNACVMTVPALAAWGIFHGLHRLSAWRQAWFRATVTGISGFLAVWGLIYGLDLAIQNFGVPVAQWDLAGPLALILHPLLVAGVAGLAGFFAWLERYSQAAPEFTLGFLVGGGAVLLTSGLNYLALILLGSEDRSWQAPAFLQVIAHLPLVPIEGLIVGTVVAFLAKVKPEMLGIQGERHGVNSQ